MKPENPEQLARWIADYRSRPLTVMEYDCPVCGLPLPVNLADDTLTRCPECKSLLELEPDGDADSYGRLRDNSSLSVVGEPGTPPPPWAMLALNKANHEVLVCLTCAADPRMAEWFDGAEVEPIREDLAVALWRGKREHARRLEGGWDEVPSLLNRDTIGCAVCEREMASL